MDWSWWPVLVVPFPLTDDGVTLDLTPVDEFLHMVGDAVGPLVVFAGVFLVARKLYVSFSGSD